MYVHIIQFYYAFIWTHQKSCSYVNFHYIFSVKFTIQVLHIIIRYFEETVYIFQPCESLDLISKANIYTLHFYDSLIKFKNAYLLNEKLIFARKIYHRFRESFIISLSNFRCKQKPDINKQRTHKTSNFPYVYLEFLIFHAGDP